MKDKLSDIIISIGVWFNKETHWDRARFVFIGGGFVALIAISQPLITQAMISLLAFIVMAGLLPESK